MTLFTLGRRLSKTSIRSTNVDKTIGNRVFDCSLSQMAIENTVYSNLRSAFVDCEEFFFDCRLPGVFLGKYHLCQIHQISCLIILNCFLQKSYTESDVVHPKAHRKGGFGFGKFWRKTKQRSYSEPGIHPEEEAVRRKQKVILAPIAAEVVCFSCLLKCLRSLYGKQCGPRSDCSYRRSLFWVDAVCFFT